MAFGDGLIKLNGGAAGHPYITNTTDVVSDITNSSMEIFFSSSDTQTDGDYVCIAELSDGTDMYSIIFKNNGTITNYNSATASTIGNYKFTTSTKIKARITVDKNGVVKVYVDEALIPNGTSVVYPDTDATPTARIKIFGTKYDAINLFYAYIYRCYINDQCLDPSDPLPDTTYSGGTLYCTNDDVRAADSGTTLYKWESKKGSEYETTTTFNLQLPHGMKIKEYKKQTQAGGLLDQLKQVKFSPSTSQFSYMEPGMFTTGDAITSTDIYQIYVQTYATDEQIDKTRNSIQVLINQKLTAFTSPPLTPSTLYDQVIPICANLTKLKLIKDGSVRLKYERTEVERQWDYYMKLLDSLTAGIVTINGVSVGEDNIQYPKKTTWQENHGTDRMNRYQDYYNDDYGY